MRLTTLVEAEESILNIIIPFICAELLFPIAVNYQDHNTKRIMKY